MTKGLSEEKYDIASHFPHKCTVYQTILYLLRQNLWIIPVVQRVSVLTWIWIHSFREKSGNHKIASSKKSYVSVYFLEYR